MLAGNENDDYMGDDGDGNDDDMLMMLTVITHAGEKGKEE